MAIETWKASPGDEVERLDPRRILYIHPTGAQTEEGQPTYIIEHTDPHIPALIVLTERAQEMIAVLAQRTEFIDDDGHVWNRVGDQLWERFDGKVLVEVKGKWWPLAFDGLLDLHDVLWLANNDVLPIGEVAS